MAGELWSDEELEASVAAYLEMLRSEAAGQPFSKASVKRKLLAGPLANRQSVDYRMGNISSVMRQMGRPWLSGFAPRQNVGSGTQVRLQAIIENFDGLTGTPKPKFTPVAVHADRKLPPTGYWMFVCKRSRWNGEGWLRSGETDLLYMVSEHNRSEVQVGDLGVLRFDKLWGTKSTATQPAGAYAIVEITEAPAFRVDPDPRFYADAADAAGERWRAKLRLVANLVDGPVGTDQLPDTAEFEYFRRPLQTSSIPLSAAAFQAVVTLAGDACADINAVLTAVDPGGVKALEVAAQGRSPKVKERLSKVIERGPEGNRVKAARGYQCQICQALDLKPFIFQKLDGALYAEAHHVMPVANLAVGSLDISNIMVLCANHHRQAHYGKFDVVGTDIGSWTVVVDGRQIAIERM